VADNTTPAFRVYNLVTNDNYILAETVTGSETLTVGKAALTATAVDGQTVAITSTDTITATGGGAVLIDSTAGSTTIKGGTTIDIGGVGTSSIDIAASGARTTRVGSTLATSTTVAASGSYMQLNSSGVALQIDAGFPFPSAAFAIFETGGGNVFSATWTGKPNIVIGDTVAFPTQDVTLDGALTFVQNAFQVAGTSEFDDVATFDSDIALQGGGNITDGTNTAIAVSSSGDITAFGQGTPASGDVLSWDGAKYIPSTPAAPGTTITAVTERVQLADLPAADTTGAVNFGTSIGANTVIVGAAVYLNADPTVGTSGITSTLNVTVAQGDSPGLIIETLNLFGATGSPKYFTASSNPSDFQRGPFISVSAGQPGYQISGDGGSDLSQLGAFDITIVLFVTDLAVTVP
jgi:hypothetical protein